MLDVRVNHLASLTALEQIAKDSFYLGLPRYEFGLFRKRTLSIHALIDIVFCDLYLVGITQGFRIIKYIDVTSSDNVDAIN